MDTAVLKDRLHEYIERADNEHLAAMYILLEKEMEPDHLYDANTLKMLYERIKSDESGRSKSYSSEEAFTYIRAQKPDQ